MSALLVHDLVEVGKHGLEVGGLDLRRRRLTNGSTLSRVVAKALGRSLVALLVILLLIAASLVALWRSTSIVPTALLLPISISLVTALPWLTLLLIIPILTAIVLLLRRVLIHSSSLSVLFIVGRSLAVVSPSLAQLNVVSASVVIVVASRSVLPSLLLSDVAFYRLAFHEVACSLVF